MIFEGGCSLRVYPLAETLVRKKIIEFDMSFTEEKKMPIFEGNSGALTGRRGRVKPDG